MCEPLTLMTAASMGLSTIGSVAGIQNQNRAAVANSRNARAAMNDEIVTTTEQYIEQNRSLLQGSFDSILAGRSDAALAYTSAIENGAQGASIKAILRDNRQRTGRNQSRFQNESDSLATQAGANYRHITSKAQGRINSVPTTSFGLGDLAKIAGAGLQTQSMG